LKLVKIYSQINHKDNQIGRRR